MTIDELRRIGQYVDRINEAGGSLLALNVNERRDLQKLLNKWVAENYSEVSTEI